jgi:hypothetical protein
MMKTYKNINEWLEAKGQPLAAVGKGSVAVLEYDGLIGENHIVLYYFTEYEGKDGIEPLVIVSNGYSVNAEHFGSLKNLLNSMEV